MAAPPLAQSPVVPTNTFLARLFIEREGEFPAVRLVFAHVGDADGVNSFGEPKYPKVLPDALTYFIFTISSETQVGLMRLVTLMGAVTQRILAEETFDAAVANAAYDLLSECTTLNSTAAIRDQLGITIQGNNPFLS